MSSSFIITYCCRHDVVSAAYCRCGVVLHDASEGVIHGNLVAVVAFFLHVLHVADGELRNVIVVFQLQHLLYRAFHFVGINKSVNEFGAFQVLRVVEHYAAVGPTVE